MAVNLATVTGNLETLIGGTPSIGRLWFRLTMPDWNDDGNIFAPQYVEAVADPTTGAFSVSLQSTDDFEVGATYRAILKYFDIDGLNKEYELGAFAVGTGGPFELTDLLAVPVVEPVPADILALALAAQAAAENAAAEAAALATPYASRAAAEAATVPAHVTRIAYRQGARVFTFSRPPAPVTYPALVTVGGEHWVPDGEAWLEHYGAFPSDLAGATTDYTAQVQQALNGTLGDLHISGWVKITDWVAAPNGCTPRVVGGSAYGGFKIDSDFNMARAYVFKPGASEPGSRGVVLGLHFVQPATPASRADLIQYPWAIDLGTAPATPRVFLDRIRIEAAWNGIRMVGNAGGVTMGEVEVGAFNTDLEIDGPLDFVHIDCWRSWPFMFAGNATLMALYQDGNGLAALLKTCDGFHCNNFSSYGKSVQLEHNAASIIPYMFGSMKLDGDAARFLGVSGRANIATFYTTKSAAPTDPTILISGADVTMGSARISGGETVQARVTSGRLQIRGGEIYSTTLGAGGAEVSGGVLDISGVTLRWASGTRTQPMVRQSGTGVLRTKNLTPAVFNTTSPLIALTTDVTGNFVDAQDIHPCTVALPTPYLFSNARLPQLYGFLTLTCATPGDLAGNALPGAAYWQLDGGICDLVLRSSQFTPTFTTASGALRLDWTSGDQPPKAAQVYDFTSVDFQGFTLPGGCNAIRARRTATGEFSLFGVGPAVAPTLLGIANITSGVAVQIAFSGPMLVRT